MDRRRFLQAGGALVAGGLLADLDFFESAASAAARSQARPNIVFILVDEMRFPTEFPAGVRSPAQFLHRFMPNLYELWRHGVKFESYYSAGNACSPARATLATGLYPHQEWLLATRTAAGAALQPNFPTYGKLLQAFRLPDALHRQVASVKPAVTRRPRLPEQLRLPGVHQPGSHRHQRPG